MVTKIRSNVYLDKEIKEKAKEIFKEYGLSLSDGINMLLNRVVKGSMPLMPKEFDIEPVDKDDPDHKVLQEAKKRYKKHPEDYVDFNDIDWD